MTFCALPPLEGGRDSDCCLATAGVSPCASLLDAAVLLSSLEAALAGRFAVGLTPVLAMPLTRVDVAAAVAGAAVTELVTELGTEPAKWDDGAMSMVCAGNACN